MRTTYLFTAALLLLNACESATVTEAPVAPNLEADVRTIATMQLTIGKATWPHRGEITQRWSDAGTKTSHVALDIRGDVSTPIFAPAAGVVVDYTRAVAGGFGSYNPDQPGPVIFLKVSEANGAPGYFCLGHAATSWIDNTTLSPWRFQTTYTVPTIGSKYAAGDRIAFIAPYWNGGKPAAHLHLCYFKPARKPDGSYHGPPSSNWGYGPAYLSTGSWLNPEVVMRDFMFVLRDGATSAASLTLAPTVLLMPVGESRTIIPTVRDMAGKPAPATSVTWTTSSTQVVRVSNGTITSIAPGIAVVTATAFGKSATVVVTVTAPAIATITVSPATLSLPVGSTGSLVAVARGSNGVTVPGVAVTWSSSDNKIVRVDGGTLTGVSAGTAVITGSAGGKSATSRVTVVPPTVVGVIVSPVVLQLVVGQNALLAAATRMSNGVTVTGATVSWSSSDTRVAKVVNGTVTAAAQGTATITAFANGRSATAHVTVTSPPSAMLLVSPHSADVELNSKVVPTISTSTISIAATGGARIPWTISASVPWLRFSASSGTTPAQVTVWWDATAFPKNSPQSGLIQVRSSTGSAVTIPVALSTW